MDDWLNESDLESIDIGCDTTRSNANPSVADVKKEAPKDDENTKDELIVVPQPQTPGLSER